MNSHPIAIFLHARLSGNGIEYNHAVEIFQEVTRDIQASGLEAGVDSYFICTTGGEANHVATCMLAPAKAQVIRLEDDATAELPTIERVRQWAEQNPKGKACYLHLKGALHNGGTKTTWTRWRHCMSNVVVWNWRECVKALDEGYDCAGAHWLTPQQYPSLLATPYWAGNFWWSASRHINRCPAIDIRHPCRHEAEAFIGRAKGHISAMDFAPHFPMQGCQ